MGPETIWIWIKKMFFEAGSTKNVRIRIQKPNHVVVEYFFTCKNSLLLWRLDLFRIRIQRFRINTMRNLRGSRKFWSFWICLNTTVPCIQYTCFKQGIPVSVLRVLPLNADNCYFQEMCEREVKDAALTLTAYNCNFFRKCVSERWRRRCCAPKLNACRLRRPACLLPGTFSLLIYALKIIFSYPARLFVSQVLVH